MATPDTCPFNIGDVVRLRDPQPPRRLGAEPAPYVDSLSPAAVGVVQGYGRDYVSVSFFEDPDAGARAFWAERFELVAANP